MSHHDSRSAVFLMLLAGSSLTMAQSPAWIPLDTNERIEFELSAYEHHTGRPVAIWSQFQGATRRLMEWDGSNWYSRVYSTLPPIAFNPTNYWSGNKLAYDAQRGVTVLVAATSPPSVWEWNGVDWNQRITSTTLPQTSCISSLGWHGRPGAAELLAVVAGDIWGYDGTDWRLRGTLPFDAQTSVFVPGANLQLFARRTGPWAGSMVAWDGTTATPVQFTGAALWDGVGSGARIVFDEAGNRLVMATPSTAAPTSFAGTLTQSAGNVTVNWTPLAGFGPFGQSVNMLYDRVRSRVLFFGGYFSPAGAQVTALSSNATTWTTVPRLQDVARPGPRSAIDLAWDRQRQHGVMFGGSDANAEFLAETWTFDGRQWQSRGIAPNVLGRHSAALAWVGSRGQTLMFGGATESAGAVAEMYGWDGNGWNAIGWTGPAPGPRYLHDMVWHEARNRVVVFGGTDGGANVYNETWEFDPQAQTWQQITTPVTPPPRNFGRMAYDAQRQRVVLFGGAGAAGPLADTWVYSSPSSGWTQVTAPTFPAARWGHAMDYDPRRQRIVLHGGYALLACGSVLCPTPVSDHWEFDSSTWVPHFSGPATAPDRISTNLPPARATSGMTFDHRNQRFVLFGGNDTTARFGDTWLFDSGTDTFATGQTSGGIALRSRTPAVAGAPLALEFENPSAFGWMAVHLETSPAPTHFIDPPLACASRAWFFGLNPIVANVGGNPGRLEFVLPTWTLGLGFTFQAIALDAQNVCLRASDPLAMTVRTP